MFISSSCDEQKTLCIRLSTIIEPYSSRILPFVIQDLKDYMRQAGEVTFADAHKLRQGEG